jgi:hypothetical protein
MVCLGQPGPIPLPMSSMWLGQWEFNTTPTLFVGRSCWFFAQAGLEQPPSQPHLPGGYGALAWVTILGQHPAFILRQASLAFPPRLAWSPILIPPSWWDYRDEHCTQLIFFWDRVSLTFLPRWASSSDAPISASWVAGLQACLATWLTIFNKSPQEKNLCSFIY